MIRQMFSHSRRADGVKEKRLREKHEHEKDRRDKLDRTRHKDAAGDVAMANNLRPFGVDYLNTPRDQVVALVRQKTEGKLAEKYPQQALDFLQENFDMEYNRNDYGQKFIHFPEKSNKGDAMSLIGDVAEHSGETRKSVKVVLEGLQKAIRVGLKNDRRVRLPDIGVIKVTFRPAREKQKNVPNPFRKGEKYTVKARPASNKIRFTVAKALKEYVAEKVEVIAPPKKKKK